MAVDNSQSQDVDLDRTDRLPVLSGAAIAEEVVDDAVRLDLGPVVPSVKPEFPRPAGLDLPMLAESVRSVEERIARQNAEYEALSRSYEKARDAEITAVSRAHALSLDLAALRSLLETEQARSRDLDKVLADKDAALEATHARSEESVRDTRARADETVRDARSRSEEALREAEKYQSEARTLRDTLAARDAAVVQVTHSLGERDAQLSALQREHAQVVPALEERSKVGVRLEADLKTERERAADIAIALRDTQQTVAALTARMKAGDEELNISRRDLHVVKTQASTYLETLRTREWRRGFDQNVFLDLDAKIGAAQDDRGQLQSERDQLRQRVADHEAKLAAREKSISQLNAAATDDEAMRSKQDLKLQQLEGARSDLAKQIEVLGNQKHRLNGDLEDRDATIAKLQNAVAGDEAARTKLEDLLKQSERAAAELTGKMTALEAERNRLSAEVAHRDEGIANLKIAAATDDSERSKHELMLQQVERACAELTAQIAAMEKEKTRLHGELSVRDQLVASAQAASLAEAQRGQVELAASRKEIADLGAQLTAGHAELKKRDDEMSVLMAHLKEARRPLEPIEAEIKRLSDDLATKAAAVDALNEDNRTLKTALERAKGALEEREFLIRRLERSESNNANVLGRIQTSIERLGSPTPIVGNAPPQAPGVECTAELVRIDGQHNTSHVLARRTRIGRAPGCEMQIESSSVSRHHALVLMSTRDVIIEDLNSTNGVLVNGRKVSRQLLNDGDVLAIGEAQFRLSVKFAPRTLEAGGLEVE